jgi:hypothetical protein
MDKFKVGDEVARCLKGNFNYAWEILTITGETPTQWKTGDYRWRKKDGREVGVDERHSVWGRSFITKVTPSIRKSARRQEGLQ